VVRTYKHLAHETITVRLADRAEKVVQTLTATPDHRFFVVGHGAVALRRLGIGTQVITRAGPPLVIRSLVKHEYPKGIPVYNFEVQGDHTYFVGTAHGGTWVHNRCANDLHHIFPNKFKSFFRDAGLDNNQYTVELDQHVHLSGVHGVGGLPFPNGMPGILPGRYNQVWADWIAQNPNADVFDIVDQGIRMIDQYGLGGLPIVPYK
jgi:hypothetical protein